MKKILVTGVNGFIGKNIYKDLIKLNYFVRGAVRNLDTALINSDTKYISVGNIDVQTKWSNALEGVDCVIHCAGKTHVINKKDELDIYRTVNREGTKHLAEQAVKAGVKRLIFLSSVKVNGETTFGSLILKHNDISQPEDAYGISKWEAEQALLEISKQTGLEVVIIRPPLVYGEGVKGNFLRLLDLVYKQIPLPFAKINNLRSFVGLDNLIDLIICCIDHPKAGGKTFLVSDGEDLSTLDLIRKLSKFMNKSPRLFQVPQLIIQLIGRLVGKSSEVKRLLGSLRVDNSYTSEILGWSPALSLDESLEKTVRWYLKNR
jgi:nucleoside-diphosphate-sugar epimerase